VFNPDLAMNLQARYTIVRKIADGGTAEIFLATQHGAQGFEKTVVLKRIFSAFYADPQFRNMLIDEALIAMSLNHSNIVQVLDLGESHGQYVMALELVDGWSLDAILRRTRALATELPPELSLYITAEVCRALAYAHAKSGPTGQPLGIVHRDISPHNVLISEQGEVKLTDFGIAKAHNRREQSLGNLIKGKIAFMSPEQASGRPLDARSDLFSLGTMLYVMLCRRYPFDAATDLEVLLLVKQGACVPPEQARPGLHAEVYRVLERAMAADPADRYQRAEDMLLEVEQVMRLAFRAVGQTELKRWLAELSEHDGIPPLTRMRPAAEPGTGAEVSARHATGTDARADSSAAERAATIAAPLPIPPEASGSTATPSSRAIHQDRTPPSPPSPLAVALTTGARQAARLPPPSASTRPAARTPPPGTVPALGASAPAGGPPPPPAAALATGRRRPPPPPGTRPAGAPATGSGRHEVGGSPAPVPPPFGAPGRPRGAIPAVPGSPPNGVIGAPQGGGNPAGLAMPAGPASAGAGSSGAPTAHPRGRATGGQASVDAPATGRESNQGVPVATEPHSPHAAAEITARVSSEDGQKSQRRLALAAGLAAAGIAAVVLAVGAFSGSSREHREVGSTTRAAAEGTSTSDGVAAQPEPRPPTAPPSPQPALAHPSAGPPAGGPAPLVAPISPTTKVAPSAAGSPDGLASGRIPGAASGSPPTPTAVNTTTPTPPATASATAASSSISASSSGVDAGRSASPTPPVAAAPAAVHPPATVPPLTPATASAAAPNPPPSNTAPPTVAAAGPRPSAAVAPSAPPAEEEAPTPPSARPASTGSTTRAATAASAAEPDDGDTSTAESQELQPRMAILFKTSPAGAEVTSPRHSFGTTPVTIRLRLGARYALTFTRDGFRPVTRRIVITPGSDPEITVSLKRLGSAKSTTAPAPSAPPASPSSKGNWWQRMFGR
jgi:serine/threonine protein kinase